MTPTTWMGARWGASLVTLVTLVVACSTAAPGAPTQGPGSTAQPAGTSAAATPAGSAAFPTALTTPKTVSGALVDLTFTGTRVFTAKGTVVCA